MTADLIDRHSRPLRDLRLSVIDQCNLRCNYCMPEEHYAWLPKQDLLTINEISRLVGICISLGTRKVRLTGGEPLIRKDLPDIIRVIAAKLGTTGLQDLAITTNGVLLAGRAADLHDAGLTRVTVSLDTLRPERFAALSKRHNHGQILDGIRTLAHTGFTNTKLDSVIIRGVNDDELADLIEFGRQHGAEVRFIEYMDVGGATQWSRSKVFPKAEMLAALTARYGQIRAVPKQDSAPARQFVLPDGTAFGIVASTTDPFCATCDRARLTADGLWLTCLYALNGVDLRGPMRAGASDTELADLISGIWRRRSDRGAELRLSQRSREVFVPLEQLQRDPHLEMHTRGG